LKRGKRYKEVAKKVEKSKAYTLAEAFSVVRQTATAKFDETVEVACRLGVDPRKADQMVRGTVILPHGTGKKIRVLVLTKGEKASEAKEAGADMVGADDYIEKIKGGLGKILGPKGLMPNPKAGTVTKDIAKAVKDLKAGKIEYRVDKTGNIHCGIGKLSFADEQLIENAEKFLGAIARAKPTSAKGTYLKNASVCSTMGPGVKLDTQEILTFGR